MENYRSLDEWKDKTSEKQRKMDGSIVQIRVSGRRSGYDPEKCRQMLLQSIEKSSSFSSFDVIDDQTLGVLLASGMYSENEARSTAMEFLHRFNLYEFCTVKNVWRYGEIFED